MDTTHSRKGKYLPTRKPNPIQKRLWDDDKRLKGSYRQNSRQSKYGQFHITQVQPLVDYAIIDFEDQVILPTKKDQMWSFIYAQCEHDLHSKEVEAMEMKYSSEDERYENWDALGGYHC